MPLVFFKIWTAIFPLDFKPAHYQCAITYLNKKLGFKMKYFMELLMRYLHRWNHRSAISWLVVYHPLQTLASIQSKNYIAIECFFFLFEVLKFHHILFNEFTKKILSKCCISHYIFIMSTISHKWRKKRNENLKFLKQIFQASISYKCYWRTVTYTNAQDSMQASRYSSYKSINKYINIK